MAVSDLQQDRDFTATCHEIVWLARDLEVGHCAPAWYEHGVVTLAAWDHLSEDYWEKAYAESLRLAEERSMTCFVVERADWDWWEIRGASEWSFSKEKMVAIHDWDAEMLFAGGRAGVPGFEPVFKPLPRLRLSPLAARLT
jgi:hypothetical protein